MLLTLPQETVNEVVAHLRSEERALRSLSVVAKRLTEECRRHLFASIHVDSRTKVARWCDAIPPGEDGLSRYVRLLDLDGWSEGSLSPSVLLPEHLVHLRSLTRVEHLKIRPLNFYKFSSGDLVDCFGQFSSTIRSICIRPTGDSSALLHFLAMFPLLESTLITSPVVWRKSEVVDLPDFVCRGDLILKACKIGDGENILSCLTRPTTRYRSLGLGLVKVDNPAPLERFFRVCGGSLESIQFICCFFSPLAHCPDTLLSPLTELQDITLSIRFFNGYSDVSAILSSITSTKINSVTLFVWECPTPNDFGGFSLRWVKIENALCRLSGLKKGTGSVGEIVLDVYLDNGKCTDGIPRLSERGEFMPRFRREGGVVNVKMQPVDLNRAMLSIVPDEFR